VGKDGPEGPGDSNGGREVAFRSREGICSSSTLKEEEGKENENFGPDAGGVVETTYTKGIECSNDDENGSPTMVEREREMNEKFICKRLGTVMLLYDVIDMRDRGADKESKDEGNDVMVSGPQVDVDGIEDTEEGETP